MMMEKGRGCLSPSRGPLSVGGGPCQAALGRRRLFPLPALNVDPACRAGRSKKQQRKDRGREIGLTLAAESLDALNLMCGHHELPTNTQEASDTPPR